jgi:hypothetical protein
LVVAESSTAAQLLKIIPLLATAAQKLGLNPQQAVSASNSVGSVLESTIKEIPKNKILDTLREKSLTATKKHFLIPTTSITVKLE